VFCVQCYANHKKGPVPQHHDNITHALFACPHTDHTRLSLTVAASTFLNTHKIAHRYSGTSWQIKPWTSISEHHRLLMLLGGKLSASDWHHNSQDLEDIHQWHIKFLETMVPKVHKILQAKGIQTKIIQSGSGQNGLPHPS
jgi:hypothetical protein